MANITAQEVKKLRDLTGAGMMDCKRALEEADGDVDKAIEVLRIKGDRKIRERGEQRTASAGLIASQNGALVELNSETDFVAKSEDFQRLAADVVAAAATAKASDPAAVGVAVLADGRTVDEAIASVAAIIGEKVQLGRVAYVDDPSVVYLHRRASDLPPAVGVIVGYDGDDDVAALDVAMQVAAMRPTYISRDDVPAEVIAKEREIAEATAREEGKPEQALGRIVDGRLNGFFKETVLLEQPFVKDSKQTVKSMIDDAGINVKRFVRFEVGQR